MKTVDTWNTSGGKINFTIFTDPRTDVHVFIETKYTKMGGVKTKATQAHKTECQRLFERAVLQAKRAAEKKAKV